MKAMLLSFFLLSSGFLLKAQPTTAMDFNMTDCRTGAMHHLFSELDSGKVVIMEFFMINCYPCVDAGVALEAMYQDLKNSCGNNVLYYQTAFNNSYKCSHVTNWQDSSGFTAVPFDSGAAQISYYGFFGMPTIAVAAGSTHQLLYLYISGGFAISDTATIATSIRNFCATSGIKSPSNAFVLSAYPNPASSDITISLNQTATGTLTIEVENVLGETIKLITNEKIAGGEWKQTFSMATLPHGTYVIKANFNDIDFYKVVIH